MGPTMYTKTITQDIDWLRELSGLTVEKAIAYLQTLNPEHVLEYNLEGGDTHGVEVVSTVCYDVPMTNAEILAMLEKDYARKIAEREKGRQYYIDRGQLDRVPNSDRLIVELKEKLAQARAKYG